MIELTMTIICLALAPLTFPEPSCTVQRQVHHDHSALGRKDDHTQPRGPIGNHVVNIVVCKGRDGRDGKAAQGQNGRSAVGNRGADGTAGRGGKGGTGSSVTVKGDSQPTSDPCNPQSNTLGPRR